MPHRILNELKSLLLRWLTLILILPLLLVHRLALALDVVLFPAIRRTPVSQPLFIVGLPRSGTTWAHRLTNCHSKTFTTMQLWELLFAPALCEKLCLRALYRVDARLGGWGISCVRGIQGWLLGGQATIHPTGLEQPEEDFLALLPYDGCFLRVLLWPYARKTWRLGNFAEKMSPRERNYLVSRYRALVQRHLVFAGRGSYLCKNPSFSSWLPDLSREFPDARFIGLHRDPAAVVASQLSSLRSTLQLYGHAADDPLLVELFVSLLASYRRELLALAQRLPADRCQLIAFSQLVQQPFSTLTRALDELGYELHPDGAGALQTACATSGQPRRRHRYALHEFGLTERRIACAFADSAEIDNVSVAPNASLPLESPRNAAYIHH